MNCMKCGAKIEHDQVFCPDCLAEMEKYPVKPGITVQIPPQRKSKPQPASKNAIRHQSKAELEVKYKKLKSTNRTLIALCIILFVTTLVFGAMTFNILERWELAQQWGKNYQTVVETNSTNPT